MARSARSCGPSWRRSASSSGSGDQPEAFGDAVQAAGVVALVELGGLGGHEAAVGLSQHRQRVGEEAALHAGEAAVGQGAELAHQLLAHIVPGAAGCGLLLVLLLVLRLDAHRLLLHQLGGFPFFQRLAGHHVDL
jgi:hypothetical protein